MDHAEATEFVVRELGKHRSRDDIIRTLCEQAEFDWRQATQFVRRVETEHGQRIAMRQSPLIVILGVGTILAGIVITLWVTVETLNGTIIFLLSLPIPYLGNLVYFTTGLGMIAGGCLGLWQTIKALWSSE